MTDPQPLPIQPFFGGFILETLTVGMYGESRNAIREYIQNSFDSIQRATDELKILKPREGLIEVMMSNDALIVRDNGAGLSIRQAADTLTSVGASSKDFRTEAGFRGIGRLAGIVFSDTVTFTTKAKGEKDQTAVIFKAKKMRELMSPTRGGGLSAEQLLRESVSAQTSPASDANAHFFEVKLEGFTDAPEECTSFSALASFLAQVAPVPYGPTFPFGAQLAAAAKEAKIPIEEVRLTLKDGDNAPEPITKLYTTTYDVDEEGGVAEVAECEIFHSPTKSWWAWVGKKSISGSYVDGRIRGLRVRSKNIQIDGTDVIREIFQQHAKSYVRFQDWYLGEVFVASGRLIPNARRDGFEETNNWKTVRTEFAGVCKELGKQAYELSNAGQLTLAMLTDKVTDVREAAQALRRTDYRNIDRTLAHSADITKLQARVARAAKNADPETLASLQALGSELLDFKSEAVSKVAAAADPVDLDALKQETRDALLRELMTLFESNLGTPCLVAVRNLVRDNYGEEVI